MSRRADRLAFLGNALASGITPSRAVAALSAKTGVSRATCYRSLGELYRQWQDDEARDRPHVRRRRLEFLDQVAARALAKDKFQAAVGAVLAAAKIEGLFEETPQTAQGIGFAEASNLVSAYMSAMEARDRAAGEDN